MAEIKIEVRAIDLERLGISLCFINTDSAERKFFALQNAKLIADAFASPPVAVQEEGDAWQPIETAPKTSRAILVWCPAIRCTFAVSWCDDAWLYFGGSGYLREAPTLWQPMVAPPAAMKGDQP